MTILILSLMNFLAATAGGVALAHPDGPQHWLFTLTTLLAVVAMGWTIYRVERLEFIPTDNPFVVISKDRLIAELRAGNHDWREILNDLDRAAPHDTPGYHAALDDVGLAFRKLEQTHAN